MPRRPRNPKLETRNARHNLPASKEVYWSKIHPKLFIGYRKGPRSFSWCYRLGLDSGGYKKGKIGISDDISDANGIRVLNYDQAVRKAMEIANTADRESINLEFTVADAIENYLDWYRVKARDGRMTELVIQKHIVPVFSKRKVSSLTSSQIRKWHQNIAKTDDPTKERSRKQTANRVLTVFKAILNRAYKDDKVESKDAWTRVEPFKKIDPPKPRFLTKSECKRLINASAPEIKPLVQAALLCGGRYGELINVTVSDFDATTGKIALFGKDEETRIVPLTEEGIALFSQHSAGKLGSEYIFTRNDGSKWGRSHQTRPIKEACLKAKINPPISFKGLRTTYGSLLAMNHTPMKIIAELMGHSDTRITEKHYAHLQESHIDKTLRSALPKFGIEKTNIVEINEAAH